jgi:aminopeptidase YwaD
VDELETCLQQHVANLSYVRHNIANPSGLKQARAYIEQVFDGLGFEVRREKVPAVPGEYNILARMPGDTSDLKLIIEAHHDTVENSPGADDNASGVAGVLEVARLLGPQPGIEYASFCLEEQKLQGAVAYVENLARDARPQMIDLEMIGFTRSELLAQTLPVKLGPQKLEVPLPATGRTIAIVGDWKSRHLTRLVATACCREGQPALALSLPLLAQLIPDIRRSDHAPFWKRGLEAVMVTDTANFRNPHYHRMTDVPESLDLSFAARISRAVTAYAATINR